jgi:hypothetical protein
MLTAGYLDVLPDPILSLYDEYAQSVINDMAKRLAKGTAKELEAAAWQMQRLSESGKVYEHAIEELAKMTGKSEAVLRDLFEKAGVKAMKFDDAVYKAAGLDPLPLNLSPAMSQVLAAGLQKTGGIMRNLTQTTALTSQEAFIHAADLAYVQISSGAMDYQQAIREAVVSVADQGVTVIHYASGHREQLDVALRRTILTGVNQTAGKLAETRADEMGADLVQTSAHIGARNTGTGPANHEGWQGRIFSRSATHDEYPAFVESTGYGTGPGLMGWNCRHSWYPYFEGISAQHYQQAELDDYANKRVTYDGQEMSVYEATQEQRAIERSIRKAKRRASALEAADLDNTAELAKVRRGQAKMRAFTRQTGLKRDRFREQVHGGGPLPKVVKKPDAYEQAIIDNRQSLERAAQITPAALDAGVDGNLADYMYNFFSYDDLGNPTFSPELLNNTKNDLLYNIWSMGKGRVTDPQMHPIREKAAALLSGHTQTGGKVFSLKERRILERLASADDDTALAEIDAIRDKRLKGRLAQKRYGTGGGTGTPDAKFISAQEEDSIKYLREANRPQWMR